MCKFLVTTLILLTTLLTSAPGRAAENALTEKQRIEALITHVESLKDATFIRNGTEYSAKNAARFLRGKWQRQEKQIATAADFIEKAASASSTSGKPYIIRLKDAREVRYADYFANNSENWSRTVVNWFGSDRKTAAEPIVH